MKIYKKVFGAFLLALLVVMTSVPAFAQAAEGDESQAVVPSLDSAPDENEDELTDLSLEELLDISIVTVASKKPETLIEAPGIIKAYSASDIERLGYYTLHELSQITAGFSSVRRYDLTSFEVRGLPAGGWDNNKILEMIDGIPINQARNYHAWAEEELPLYFARQVEFLKGPGSALYGTSAFLGVINMHSKDIEPGRSMYEMKMSGGDDPHNARRMMVNAGMNNGSIQAKLFAGYFERDADREVFLDSLHMWGTTAEPHYSLNNNQSKHLFLYTSAEVIDEDSFFYGLTPGLIVLERRGGLGTGWMGFSHPLDDITYRSLIPYLKYQRPINDRLSVDAFVKYQRYTEEGAWSFRMPDEPDPPADTGDLVNNYRVIVPNFEAKVDFLYNFSEDLSAIIGTDYDVRYEKGPPKEFAFRSKLESPFLEQIPLGDSGKIETRSFYGQLQKDFDILKGLGVTLGGRYDKGDSFDQFSPRIGFVQHLDDHWSVKALYGSALKAPGVKEYIHNQDVGGSSDIDAETIQTYEASLVWHDARSLASATWFYNKIEDPITRVVDGMGTTVFGNDTGHFKSQGVEVEGEWQFVAGSKLFANATYQNSEDETGDDVPLVPSWKVNYGILYDIPKWDTQVAAIVKHTDDYGREGNPYVIARNGKEVAGSTVVDLNIMKKLDENVHVELQVKNLLDEDYFHPGEDSWQAWDYPQPGREILATLNIRY